MRLRLSPLSFLVGGLFAVSAFGHVGIFPGEAPSGASNTVFTIRATVEKEVPMVELKVEVPPEWKAAGGRVDRIERDPLWKVDVDRDEDGWIRSIAWSGAEASSFSYVSFELIVTLPELTGVQQIKAFQTYLDGSVVAWVEDAATEPGTQMPAARLTLTEGVSEPGMALPLGLSGVLGGLVGAGVALAVSRNGKRSVSPPRQ